MVLNQFQLNQPVINGERFFRFITHYYNLLLKIKDKVDTYHKEDEVPFHKTGDKYIKRLYISALLLFADRFGFENLEDGYINIIYRWCYSLRINLRAVYKESINKYALGRHERCNNPSIFSYINTISEPVYILDIHINQLDTNQQNSDLVKRYEVVYNKMVRNKDA